MPALTWDANLAAVAQQWANEGTFAHNPNRSLDYQALGGSGYVGENIASGGNVSLMVGLWIAEGVDFNALTNTCAAGQV